jgi:hypothetical protein
MVAILEMKLGIVAVKIVIIVEGKEAQVSKEHFESKTIFRPCERCLSRRNLLSHSRLLRAKALLALTNR